MKKLFALILGLTLTAQAATPLMNLNLPTVGVTQGPQWATLLNSALNQIDSHNHTTGNGAKVPVAGLNINADLGLSGFNLGSVGSTRYLNQTGPLVGTSDVRSMYVVNGNLYFNNASGTAIQITSGPSINIAALGTIGGDYGGSNPAAVNFSEITSTYSFLESPGVVARMGFGPLTVFNESLGSSGVTITAPPSFSSYSMALPAAAPLDNTVLKGASSGQLSFGQVATADITDSSITTAKIVDSNVTTTKIADSSITTAKIADANVTTVKINDNSVTQIKKSIRLAFSGAAGDVAVTASSGGAATSSTSFVNVTNISFYLATLGNPVKFLLEPDASSLGTIDLAGGGGNAQFRLLRDGSVIKQTTLFLNTSASVPPGVINFTDYSVGPGTHLYTLQYRMLTGPAVFVTNCVGVGYEL